MQDIADFGIGSKASAQWWEYLLALLMFPIGFVLGYFFL